MSLLIPKLDKFNTIFAQFLNDYDVHFCRIDEIDDVVDFLDTYWKKGHVLVKSRKLMDWQHLDKANNRYNFVLARSKKNNDIHALEGFILTKQFDLNINANYLWAAIWKIREDVAPAGLGIYLWQYITENIAIDTWVCFGISNDTKNNCKFLGFKNDVVNNYFFVNPYIKEFKIAIGLKKYQRNDFSDISSYTLIKLVLADYEKLSSNESVFESVKQYKSKLYYENRYLKHPYYKYECYAIKQGQEIKSLLFVRENLANESNCLRLVEYVGDYAELQYIKKSIVDLLEEKNCEFIDIITSNVSDEVMQKANFINKAGDSTVVIPNYFEPFVQKNITIEYAYLSLHKEYVCVINKGDSDQDRPSIIND